MIVAELNIALPPWVVPLLEYLLRKKKHNVQAYVGGKGPLSGSGQDLKYDQNWS